MDDPSVGTPSNSDLLARLTELRNELDCLRLQFTDPQAQGFLFAAQGQISTYLDSAYKTSVPYYDKKSNQ